MLFSDCLGSRWPGVTVNSFCMSTGFQEMPYTCAVTLLTELQYGRRLRQFRDATHLAVKSPELVVELQMILDAPSWSEIKEASYSGAMLISAGRRRGWMDITNWCYAVVWSGLKHASHYEMMNKSKTAATIWELVAAIEARWTSCASQRPTKRAIVKIGDFMEAILSAGYYARPGEPSEVLLQKLSKIGEPLVDIERFWQTEWQFSGGVRPPPFRWARVLLVLAKWHKTHDPQDYKEIQMIASRYHFTVDRLD
jgi:hypothetical protein